MTGFPMAHEGKSATCAHLSPLGNVAAAAADTWSNESVQNVKLLGAMAPVCSLESLAYDCRLMNQASSEGSEGARKLRDWMVNSDIRIDPQAYVLSPESAIRLARAMVGAETAYHAGGAAAREAVALLREGHEAGDLNLSERELPWLDMVEQSLAALPADEGVFIDQMLPLADRTRCNPQEYDL